jgi:hypothetical protein
MGLHLAVGNLIFVSRFQLCKPVIFGVQLLHKLFFSVHTCFLHALKEPFAI